MSSHELAQALIHDPRNVYKCAAELRNKNPADARRQPQRVAGGHSGMSRWPTVFIGNLDPAADKSE